MTDEQFKIANEKMEKIRKLEEFIKAFEEPYVIDIRAIAYGKNNKEQTEYMLIKENSELYDLILNYCNSELKHLREEFKGI